MSDWLNCIRKMAEIKDIGYSQSSNQFTSFSVDRSALRELLQAYDKLLEENKILREALDGVLRQSDFCTQVCEPINETVHEALAMAAQLRSE